VGEHCKPIGHWLTRTYAWSHSHRRVRQCLL